MMKEIFTAYGPVWELWWDGANGEGPNGKKQLYDWKRFEHTVRKLSPNTIVFSDIGPDIRWCGNENGMAGATNWNYLDTAGFTRGAGAPPTDTLNQGNINGRNWIPAECDVSIRPGWFYHREEDAKVKSPAQLFDLYLKSVGRGANLLLNVPPDQRGLISKNDSAALVAFKRLRDQSFINNLATSYRVQGTTFISKTRSLAGQLKIQLSDFANETIDVQLKSKSSVNCIALEENIQKGQSVKKFKIDLYNENVVTRSVEATTIGNHRILTFPSTKCTQFVIKVEDAKFSPVISRVAAFLIEEKQVQKGD